MDYRAGLNQRETLASRVGSALDGARGVHVAVAYAKSSGVSQFLACSPPRGRAVVGLGFGVTDPAAVEQLESAGMDVRVVPDGAAVAASQFHPKLYLVERPSRLVAISGSANLTGAGWTANVEQFEELSFPDPSEPADEQRQRFEEIWDHGHPLITLRREGEWDRYRQRARDRRRLEVEDRRRLLRLQATTGQLVGHLARRSTRRAPGYLGITNDDWWALQLHLRDRSDRALFWRRSTKDFKALAHGGVFFHLVKDPGAPEELRAVRGFSVHPGVYEVGDARELFRRYRELLGVTTLGELYDRLDVRPGDAIGVIHLESLTELDRDVPLDELRANGIQFARNIVSGRRLTLEEVAAIFELGGLGVPERVLQAAEETGEGWR